MRIKIVPTLYALIIGVLGFIPGLIVGEITASIVATLVVIMAFYGLLTWRLSKRYAQAWWYIAMIMCTPVATFITSSYIMDHYIDAIRLGKPADFKGIPCQGLVKLQQNGKISRCILSRDFTLSNYLLPAKTKVMFYSDGTINACWLSRETTLYGQSLPEGTGVFFTTQGALNYCFLPRHTLIQGHLCKGRGSNYMTGFYPNGTLRVAWLARDEEIQGIPCASGFNIGTFFHENGKLQSCSLFRDVTIQGNVFRKGTQISFDRDGGLIVRK